MTELDHLQPAAAIFRPGSEVADLRQVSFGDLRDDELLVRLVGTGICHSDLICKHGYGAVPRPVVLGHEGAGIVERVGDGVTGLRPGDAVVLSYKSCGHCTACGADQAHYCEQFKALNLSGLRGDGSSAMSADDETVRGHFFGQSSFATHCVANARNAVKVPPEAPLHLLGPLGCGALTGAGAIFEVLRPQAGQAVAVFGAGGVGLSAVMAAAAQRCAPIIVIEPHADRRRLALEVGATHAIDPDAGDVADLIARIAPHGCHRILDTSGVPSVVERAVAMLAINGELGLVAAHALDAALSLPILQLMGKGVAVRGIRMGGSDPHRLIPRLVQMMADGQFPIDKLIRFYPLSALDQALEDQARGTVVKPVVVMDPHSLETLR